MSYILKALEKAEKERSEERMDETASEMDFVPLPTASSRRSRRLPLVTMGLVIALVAVGISLWIVKRSWSPAHPGEKVRKVQTPSHRAAAAKKAAQTASRAVPTHLPQSTVSHRHRTPNLSTSRRQRPLRIRTIPSKLTAVGAHSTEGAPAGKKLSRSVSSPRLREVSDAERKRQAVSSIKEHLAAVSKTPKRPKGVKDWRDLPVQVRKGIPDMRFSMLIYSDVPGDRMLSINGSVMHEGETVAPGLVLEQILPDGAIFKYEHYRFYKGVF